MIWVLIEADTDNSKGSLLSGYIHGINSGDNRILLILRVRL